MNLADLRRTLGVDGDGVGGCMGNSTMGHEADDDGLYGADSKARRRLSMERMDLLKVCFCAYAFLIFPLFAWLPNCLAARIAAFLLLFNVYFCDHGKKDNSSEMGNCTRFCMTCISSFCVCVSLHPFQFWLLTLCIIQLTPDVKHGLHSKGRVRQLHDMDAVWPRPLAGHPVVKRDMLPSFVSDNPLWSRSFGCLIFGCLQYFRVLNVLLSPAISARIYAY